MTSMEQRMARTFGLEGDGAWQRHANPWSVYTRIPGPAALVAAIWTYAWIGWWSLIPVGRRVPVARSQSEGVPATVVDGPLGVEGRAR